MQVVWARVGWVQFIFPESHKDGHAALADAPANKKIKLRKNTAELKIIFLFILLKFAIITLKNGSEIVTLLETRRPHQGRINRLDNHKTHQAHNDTDN